MPLISITELETLSLAALVKAGATEVNAVATLKALLYADKQGTASHGVSRVPQYVGHLKVGRIDGRAEPVVQRQHGAVSIIDARDGLAFPACELAIHHAVMAARAYGVGVASVTNSYHFGAAIYHLEAVAKAEMVGMAFSNSPAAIAAWGGKRPLFGTNPLAAMFPRKNGEPLAIDLAMSEVARGKLMVAAKEGKPIPRGWAMDEAGLPTTDPARGLKGSMAPTGGVKGAMLALTIELLVTALCGAHLGFEADSFFDVQGNQPRIGQLFIVIDPAAMGGLDVYRDRVETLIAAMLEEGGVRLPGARRYANAAKAEKDGIAVPDALLEQIRALATGESV
jgi:(2R)-3-sulfolactate dehydrogenase (NADP+)